MATIPCVLRQSSVVRGIDKCQRVVVRNDLERYPEWQREDADI